MRRLSPPASTRSVACITISFAVESNRLSRPPADPGRAGPEGSEAASLPTGVRAERGAALAALREVPGPRVDHPVPHRDERHRRGPAGRPGHPTRLRPPDLARRAGGGLSRHEDYRRALRLPLAPRAAGDGAPQD